MIIARSVWGARQASLPSSPMVLPATAVYIHHSVTSVTDNVYRDMREIESVGQSRFGQFPYSYCIHPKNGEILEGAGLMRGAHTAHKNSNSFGICWIGNYNDRAPKVQQLDSTRQLIATLIQRNVLRPGAVVLGHRDVFSTACPGNRLYNLLPEIRNPWRGSTMPDDPNLPNIEGPLTLNTVVDSNGVCWGYYIFSTKTGELHAHGDPDHVKYWNRSEDITP
jgi:hypothetical protein